MCLECAITVTVRKSSNVNELCARLPFKSTFGPFSNEVDSKNWATVGMRNASKPQMNNCLPGSLSTTFGVLSTTSYPGVSIGSKAILMNYQKLPGSYHFLLLPTLFVVKMRPRGNVKAINMGNFDCFHRKMNFASSTPICRVARWCFPNGRVSSLVVRKHFTIIFETIITTKSWFLL